jgi:hypothetical protein
MTHRPAVLHVGLPDELAELVRTVRQAERAAAVGTPAARRDAARASFRKALRHGLDLARRAQDWGVAARCYAGSRHTIRLEVDPDDLREIVRLESLFGRSRAAIVGAALHYARHDLTANPFARHAPVGTRR